MRVLLGSNIFTNIPYSLCCVVSTYSGLQIYIANPPRVQFFLLDSNNVKPSSFGGAAPLAIHVS